MRKTSVLYIDNNEKPPTIVETWRHDEDEINVSYTPDIGYFATVNNDITDIGHSGPNNPTGIIIWVLQRLGIL